jgi:arylsulfatase A-like enzyme
MLKGCTPSDDDAPAFYNVSRIRNVRRIYAAMVAEWDAMVGAYMQTVKDVGQWGNTVR